MGAGVAPDDDIVIEDNFVFRFTNVAAPFLSGLQLFPAVGGMVGTHFSRHPWIFNAGETLTGLAAPAGAVGLHQVFAPKRISCSACWLALRQRA